MWSINSLAPHEGKRFCKHIAFADNKSDAATECSLRNLVKVGHYRIGSQS